MEVIKAANINVQNSILVSGLTRTEADNEVFDHLKRFGSIARLVEVPSEDDHEKLIVEFTYGSAVKELEKGNLPFHRPCITNPRISHYVQSLASVYSSEISSTDFPVEPKDPVKTSKRSLEDFLREQLAELEEYAKEEEKRQAMSPVDGVTENTISGINTPCSPHTVTEPTPHQAVKIPEYQLPTNVHSTPEVQSPIEEPFSEKPAEDPPAKQMEELFLKTKAEPCIYWLPLSEEQYLQRITLRAERKLLRDKRREELEAEEEKQKEELKATINTAGKRSKGNKTKKRNKDRKRKRDRKKERKRDRKKERENDKQSDNHLRPGGSGSGGEQRSPNRSEPRE